MENFQQTKLGLLPEEWGLIKSKDFCYKVTDGTHDTPEPQSDGFFLVTSKNLIDNKIDFSSCYYISKQDFNQINQRSAVNQYDVLFGMIGTVGNTAIVTQKEIDFAIKNVGLFKLDGNYDKAIWLKNYFSSNIFSNYLRKQMAGTTQQFVGLGFLRKTPIIIPQINKEKIDWLTIRSINYVLSKVDEAIEATQNSIKASEKLKKALMQNLLTGKLKPDGTWRTDDEFYEDEKFGKVPFGWEVARVKDYGFVQTGKTPPTAESNVFSEIENEPRYPFITPGDLGESKFVSTSERFVTEKGIRYSYKLPINSICIVCIGSTIGKIGITKTEACTNQQINSLIANENNSGEFFFYMMEYRKPHFKEIAGINATPQINKSGFNKYKLLRPKEKSEQEKIVSQLNSFDEENITKQIKICTLQRLKKSLMQNLLTGKVRLDVAEVNKILKEQEL